MLLAPLSMLLAPRKFIDGVQNSGQIRFALRIGLLVVVADFLNRIGQHDGLRGAGPPEVVTASILWRPSGRLLALLLRRLFAIEKEAACA